MIYFVSCVIFYHLLQSIHIQYNTIQLYRKITVKNMGVIVKNSIDLAKLRSMKKGCRPDNKSETGSLGHVEQAMVNALPKNNLSDSCCLPGALRITIR